MVSELDHGGRTFMRDGQSQDDGQAGGGVKVEEVKGGQEVGGLRGQSL